MVVTEFCDAEALVEIGLDLPAPARLALKLRQSGLDIPHELIETNEIIQYLCEGKHV